MAANFRTSGNNVLYTMTGTAIGGPYSVAVATSGWMFITSLQRVVKAWLASMGPQSVPTGTITTTAIAIDGKWGYNTTAATFAMLRSLAPTSPGLMALQVALEAGGSPPISEEMLRAAAFVQSAGISYESITFSAPVTPPLWNVAPPRTGTQPVITNTALTGTQASTGGGAGGSGSGVGGLFGGIAGLGNLFGGGAGSRGTTTTGSGVTQLVTPTTTTTTTPGSTLPPGMGGSLSTTAAQQLALLQQQMATQGATAQATSNRTAWIIAGVVGAVVVVGGAAVMVSRARANTAPARARRGR